jgi:DNA-binding response OmpR family regulator
MHEREHRGDVFDSVENLSGSFLSHPGECSPLILDASERHIRGVDVPPLLKGEFKLLTYLGSRPCKWHTTRNLSLAVYERDDVAGKQLVWKYASTLRRKLSKELPTLIELCRKRGYSCRRAIVVA